MPEMTGLEASLVLIAGVVVVMLLLGALAGVGIYVLNRLLG